MVLQGRDSAYETDLFAPIVAAVRSALAGTGAGERDVRIVADHVRASTFMLSEGVVPSNEGRGYIPRRLLRKVIAIATQAGAADFDLRDVADAVIDQHAAHLPAARGRPRPHHGPARPRAARLRAGGPPRPGPARRAGRGPRLRDHRRRGVHAVRDARHAGRPDQGLRRRAGRVGGRAAVRRAVRRAPRALPRRRGRAGHRRRPGRAGRGGSGCCRRPSAPPPPGFSATRQLTATGQVIGLAGPRRAGRPAGRRRKRPGGLRPDSLLCRGRRPGRRHRPDHRARPVGPGDRHPERRRPSCSLRDGHRGRAAPGRHRRAGGRRGPAAVGHAEPFGDPPAARGPAPGAGPARPPGRVAGRPGPAAL